MKSNKHTLLKFFLSLFFGGCIGAIASLSLATLSKNYSFHEILDTIQITMLEHASIILLGVSIPLLLLAIICMLYMKRLYLTEVESNEDLGDKFHTFSTIITTSLIVFLFTYFGIYITKCASLKAESSTFTTVCVLFLILILCCIFAEVYGVRTYQRFHPEKKGDPLDPKFQKNWIASLDEGEKMITYVAGFKAAMLLKNLFIFTWLVLVLLSLFLDIGVAAFIVVALFWLVFNISYIIFSVRLEKGKITY